MQCIILLWQYNIHKTARKELEELFTICLEVEILSIHETSNNMNVKYTFSFFKLFDLKGPSQASQQCNDDLQMKI